MMRNALIAVAALLAVSACGAVEQQVACDSAVLSATNSNAVSAVYPTKEARSQCLGDNEGDPAAEDSGDEE